MLRPSARSLVLPLASAAPGQGSLSPTDPSLRGRLGLYLKWL